jgi:D-alanyl-lipoteichoic acid acyltransferase DltB (MBOAT superfamily)
MVFTSFAYLACFLPVAVCIAYLCTRIRHVAALVWILACSLFFYAFWKLSYLPVLLVSIFFNYFCGLLIGRSSRKKTWMALGIFVNIALIGYFKYTNFVVDIFALTTSANYHLDKIVLPLAISFFTFQQIAWLVDQYRNNAPKSSFLEYACAVAFFPHLIAGPIVQYRDLVPQFQDIKSFSIDWEFIAKGLFLIGCGVFKKIVIADTLAVYAGFGFDEAHSLNLLQAWLSVLTYTMQIYFDFSGYCDIAIGSACLLGIRLPDNFHSPYKACSIREFWQRWHMSLGRFLTSYLYVPLGGNRNGLFRTCLNVMLVMFVSGIWHGAGFGFILWGVAHGAAMVVQRLWNAAGRALPKRFAAVLTFLFVASAWVPFRATDLEAAGKVYRGMLGLDGVALPRILQNLLPSSWDIVYLGTKELLGVEVSEARPILWALLAACMCAYVCREAGQVWDTFMRRESRVTYALSFGSAALLLISFLKMFAIPYTEFIYFNF